MYKYTSWCKNPIAIGDVNTYAGIETVAIDTHADIDTLLTYNW